jgi:uncharacterized protein (DUF1499 family)
VHGLKHVPPVGLALAVLAALALAAAGPGARFGLWPYDVGFAILRWAAYAGLGAAAVALVGLAIVRLRSGWRALAAGAAGVVVGVAVAAVPWSYQQKAARLPPIHDITTDAESPPGMIALLSRRKGARNLPLYAGRTVAAQQQKAYPDIVPAVLKVPPAQAFDRARAAADRMGWTVVAASRQDGRIEAYDRTFWFGFTDDIVVRVRPAPGGSRIDIRSMSRVGRHDFGANAERVRAFLAAVRS